MQRQKENLAKWAIKIGTIKNIASEIYQKIERLQVIFQDLEKEGITEESKTKLLKEYDLLVAENALLMNELQSKVNNA